ncbi:serine/arginine repetitive matrix protein 2-like [Hoplias malabaricus]|uniref:serine/arginine repetitive matrix protein 2-like n=1 Tax=Hoplias malabaricus TaxID=27720 RepID=UPI003461EA35
MFSSNFLGGGNPLSAMSSAVNKFNLFGDEAENKQQQQGPLKGAEHQGNGQPASQGAPMQSRQQPPGSDPGSPQQQGRGRGGPQQQGAGRGRAQHLGPSKGGPEQDGAGRGGPQQQGTSRGGSPQQGMRRGGHGAPAGHEAKKATASETGAKSLCPICKNTELNLKSKEPPNHNTCTQCKSVVCSMCGFSPPDAAVREWLCLNCQMQRALGGVEPPGPPKIKHSSQPSKALTTPQPPEKQILVPAQKKDIAQKVLPQSINQQTKPSEDPKAHSRSTAAQQASTPPPSQQKPSQQQIVKGVPSPAKTELPPKDQPPKEESGFFGFGFGGVRSRSPSPQPAASAVSGKVLGFGSSFLSSASNLISSAVQDEPSTTPPTSRKSSAVSPAKAVTTPPASRKGSEPSKDSPKPSATREADKKPEQKKPEEIQPTKATAAQIKYQPTLAQPTKVNPVSPKALPKACLICKVGLKKDPPNYSTCTECKSTVCNQCGFNPTPHQSEGKHWVCLNCQTQRALKGVEPQGPPLMKPQPQPSEATIQKDSTLTYTQKQPTAQTSKTSSANPKAIQKETPKQQPSSTGAKPPDQQTAKSGPPSAKSEPLSKEEHPQEESSVFGFGFGGARSRSSSPQPAVSAVSGKVLGFGSSLFSSASNLISSAVQDEPSKTPPTSRKGSAVSQSSANAISTPPALHKTSGAQAAKVSLTGTETKPSTPQKEETTGQLKDQTTKAPLSQSKMPDQSLDMPKANKDAHPFPKACPLCKAELKKDPPNYNICTECKKTVCKLCGFNPMPHQTEVLEWLCLNCQTKRALGGASKASGLSQPPSSQKTADSEVDSTKKIANPKATVQQEGKKLGATLNLQDQQTKAPNGTPLVFKPQQKDTEKSHVEASKAVKSEKQEASGFFGFGFGSTQSHSPSPQPTASAVPGKVLGFGSSFLSSASNLISTAVQDEPSTTPPTSRKDSSVSQKASKTTPPTSRKGSTVSQTSHKPESPASTPAASRKGSEAFQDTKQKPHAKETKPCSDQQTGENKTQHSQPSKTSSREAKSDQPLIEPATIVKSPKLLPKSCLLCKEEIKKDPPNYSTCTECKAIVCNLCGFNPMPHQTEVNEWLCLKCQTQRATGAKGNKILSPSPQKKDTAVSKSPEKKKDLSDETIKKVQDTAVVKQVGKSHTPTQQLNQQQPTKQQGPEKAQNQTLKREPTPDKTKPAQESSGFFGFGSARSRSPSPQPAVAAVSGKVLGFGSSLFSSASNFISSAVQDDSSLTPPTSRKDSQVSQSSIKMTPPSSRKGSAISQTSLKTTTPLPTSRKGSETTEDSQTKQTGKIKLPTALNQEDKKNEETKSVLHQGKESFLGTGSNPEPSDLKESPQATPKDCPLCKVEIKKNPPNYNTCTQCKSIVCVQCGFNPTPHQIEVKQWLCLNCQMQQAPGALPTQTPLQPNKVLPPASSQNKEASAPEKDKKTVAHGKPEDKPLESQKKQPLNTPTTKDTAQKQLPEKPQQTKDQISEPSKEESGFFGFGFGARSRSPSPQPAVSGKVLGFGSSLLSSASNLISSAVPDGPSTSPSTSRKGSTVSQTSEKTVPTPPTSRKGSEVPADQNQKGNLQKKQNEQKSPLTQGQVNKDTADRTKIMESTQPFPKVCLLCKVEIKLDPPNYNTCTKCKNVVCELCGFNPAPDQSEVKVWHCLNCQMQQASGPPKQAQLQPVKAPSPASQQKVQVQEFQQHSPKLQESKGVPPEQKSKGEASPVKTSLPQTETSKDESGFFGFGFGGARSRSPSPQSAASTVSGKVLGFSSSFLSSASNLISTTVQDESFLTPPASRKGSSVSQSSVKSPTPPTSRKGSAVSQGSDRIPSSRQTKSTPTQQLKEIKHEEIISETQITKERSAEEKDENISELPKTCPLCSEKFKHDLPNFNTCTSCKSIVCNLCGFNPTPEKTEVKEWLCLNCQMHRAAGPLASPVLPKKKGTPCPVVPQKKPNEPVDATTNFQKLAATEKAVISQEKVHLPVDSIEKDQKLSVSGKLDDKQHHVESQKPTSSPSTAKSPPPPKSEPPNEESGIFGFSLGGTRSRSPSPQAAASAVSGKVLGFGSSFISSASNLISTAVKDKPATTPPTSRKGSAVSETSIKSGSTPPVSRKVSVLQTSLKLASDETNTSAVQKQEEKILADEAQNAQSAKAPSAPVKEDDISSKSPQMCPLCKAEFKEDPTNYSICTSCKATVCNLCGFNPMPHQTDVKEWLCLNCQIQKEPGPHTTWPQAEINKIPPSVSEKEVPTSAPTQKGEATGKDQKLSVTEKPKDKSISPEPQKSASVPTACKPPVTESAPPQKSEPTKEQSGFFGFGLGGSHSQPQSPQSAASAVSGKVLGYGSSFLSSASNLISSDVQDKPSTSPSSSRKGSTISQSSAKNALTPPSSRKGSAAPKQDEKKEPEILLEDPVTKALGSGVKKEPLISGIPKACPLCTLDLKKDPPNYNTCTECKITVCNLCGFSPIPQETEVKEWLCLNCQMKRAPGPHPPAQPQPQPTNPAPASSQMKKAPAAGVPQKKPSLPDEAAVEDQKPAAAINPEGKHVPTDSQKPTAVSSTPQPPAPEGQKAPKESISTAAKPAGVTAAQPLQQKPSQQQTAKPGPSPAKSDLQKQAEPPKMEASFFGFGGGRSRSPSPQAAASAVSGKVLGFGSSFFSSASNLISSAVQDEPSTTPSGSRKGSTASAKITPTPPASRKASVAQTKEEIKAVNIKSEDPSKASTLEIVKKDESLKPCPLCKVELKNDPPNYDTCTECKNTVCKLCGFSPMPQQTEVKEWLCLNCQMKRAPGPSPPPAQPQPQPTNPVPASPQMKAAPAAGVPQKKPSLPEDAAVEDQNPAAAVKPEGKHVPTDSQKPTADPSTPQPPAPEGQKAPKESISTAAKSAGVTAVPPLQQKPSQQQTAKPGPSPAKSDLQKQAEPPKMEASFFGFGGSRSRSPSPQAAASAVSGKVLGFGSSFFSSASNLISSAVQDEPSTTPSGSRGAQE